MMKLDIPNSVKKIVFFLITIALPFFTFRCSKTKATPPPPPPVIKPSIASFTPTSGPTGTEITINGTKLTGVAAVSFGGIAAASFSIVNDTKITAVVGTGASGDINLVTPSGTATLAGFTYVIPQPTITAISPNNGTTNSTITITGTNFTGTTAVSFGGVAASSFSVVNDKNITAIVGTGSSGNVVVSTPSGNATFGGFTYTNVSITACKLPHATASTTIGIGFPVRPYRTPSTKSVKVGVIFVDFTDNIATRTPQALFNQTLSPHAEQFLSDVSYNNLNVTFEPTFQWFRMSKPTTSYTLSTFAGHKAYIQEAISLADSKVDFSKFEHLLVISSPDAGAFNVGPTFTSNHPSNGISVDGVVLNNAITSGRDLIAWKPGLWFCHEFGHSMGLVDLYTYSGSPNLRFVGQFGIMGTIGGAGTEFFGWERWLLGWMKDDQVVCHNTTGNGSVTLTPIETAGGIKLLTIPIDANSAVVVECRRKLGYDNSLPKEGPLVYVVDTRINSGEGAIKVLPINLTDDKKLDATLSLNQTLTYNNISITYTLRSANGDLVTYEKK